MIFVIAIFMGICIGLLIAAITIILLIYFRNPIEQKINIIEKNIRIKGPRPKGYVAEAVDEIDEQREEIIQRNRDQGRDTPIQDLML